MIFFLISDHFVFGVHNVLESTSFRDFQVNLKVYFNRKQDPECVVTVESIPGVPGLGPNRPAISHGSELLLCFAHE